MPAKWIALFFVLIVAVAIGVGLGAYNYGMAAGQTRATEIRTRFMQERAGAPVTATGAAAGGAAGARGLNSDSFMAGEVKQVAGDVLELSTAREVLKVKVTAQTQIQKTVSGNLGDLQPGERVTVQGDRAADGTFSARSIQLGRGGIGDAGGPAGRGGQ